MQFIKRKLVSLGPENPAVQLSLRYHARTRGFKLQFKGACIEIYRQNQVLVLSKAQYVQVPFMIGNFDFYFNTTEPVQSGEQEILDFSGPGVHRYKRNGVEFHFPSIPEDDVMDAYTHWHKPASGQIVWDVGAHAGASTYFFSKMVGATGKVIAFEPDEINFQFLLRNIELHDLKNVILVKKALSGRTGVATFNMDGSMSAGLSDYLVYTDKNTSRQVETETLPDACKNLGGVPHFVKMDIEGAERDVIAASRSFLREHPIDFAIESNHKVDGELTYKPLERLFQEVRYKVRSSEEFGQMFTWAAPPE